MRLVEFFVILASEALPACASSNANIRPLPVASAIIVHGCAAAEADAYIRAPDGGHLAVSEVTIALKRAEKASCRDL